MFALSCLAGSFCDSRHHCFHLLDQLWRLALSHNSQGSLGHLCDWDSFSTFWGPRIQDKVQWIPLMVLRRVRHELSCGSRSPCGLCHTLACHRYWLPKDPDLLIYYHIFYILPYWQYSGLRFCQDGYGRDEVVLCDGQKVMHCAWHSGADPGKAQTGRLGRWECWSENQHWHRSWIQLVWDPLDAVFLALTSSPAFEKCLQGLLLREEMSHSL